MNIAALERGWIPNGNLNDIMITTACAREDTMDFKCILKRGQLESNIYGAVNYIIEQEHMENSTDLQAILNMTGPDLDNAAGSLITDYFEKNRHQGGATCDFGGIAMLVELNRTITNTDPLAYQYDEYIKYIQRGPALWVLVVGGFGIAISAGLIGFIIAMRRNPTFNRRVRSNPLFMSVTKSSGTLFRSTLNIPALGEEYMEILRDEDRKHNYNTSNNNNNYSIKSVGSETPLSL